MKVLFYKPLRSYVIGLFLLILITGIVLNQALDNLFMVIAVLAIEYIVLVLILLSIYDRYIKPIDKVITTVDQLVDGNFRARIHQKVDGNIGVLNNKINVLARNLSDLSIHEQMQAEQLSTVINNTQSGLVLIDEKGYIHFVNQKFITMFGKTPKDYKGYLYYDVLEEEKIHQTIQETFLHEKNIKDTFIHQKGISKYYLEIVGAPIFNDRNNLKGAVLVLYDITELKKLESMRKDFVANVSHELKTPMTSIRGFAETLLDGALEDKDTTEQFIEIIYEESKRLQYLIDDLLTLSKIEKEEYYLKATNINMKELLAELAPMIKHKAEQQNITFTAEIHDDLFLFANEEQVKQVLINLLDNAISYTPEHGEVTLQVDALEDSIQIQVKDTGIGIEAADIPRLFERFYRVDKARSRNTGGTGLGLAIVKHIIEIHGGSIVIDSIINEGTTFSIYFPKENTLL